MESSTATKSDCVWARLDTAATSCGRAGVRPSPGATAPASGLASKKSCAHGGAEPAAPGDGRTPVAVSRCAPFAVAVIGLMIGETIVLRAGPSEENAGPRAPQSEGWQLV